MARHLVQHEACALRFSTPHTRKDETPRIVRPQQRSPAERVAGIVHGVVAFLSDTSQ
jgi:hypothetical protein